MRSLLHFYCFRCKQTIVMETGLPNCLKCSGPVVFLTRTEDKPNAKTSKKDADAKEPSLPG